MLSFVLVDGQIDKVNFPEDAVLTWNDDRTSLKFRVPHGTTVLVR